MNPSLTSLPSLVPFPETDWIAHLAPTEWEACLDSWILLAGAHLSLPISEFEQRSLKDESLTAFLTSYAAQVASAKKLLSSMVESPKFTLIRKMCFLLSHRLVEHKNSPHALLCCDFLADASKTFGKSHGRKLIELVRNNHLTSLELSMTSLKMHIIEELDAGVTRKLEDVKNSLKKLNSLLYVCHKVAVFFMAGSDFLDALITGYKTMNLPLRKIILSTLYLCLIGLTEGEKPNISSLVDQLYSLKLAAEEQQVENPHANDTIISELVSSTPILRKVREKLKINDSGPTRIDSILVSLENFRKAGTNIKKIRRPAKTKVEKGKYKASNLDDENHSRGDQAQVHRMSLITQIQDLLPDLGPGFISKLFDEYKNNVEIIISHLLEGSLPAHLEKLDRAAPLNAYQSSDSNCKSKAKSLLPQLPTRHNVFDEDEINQLALNTSRLHFGRQNNSRTAETILNDRSSAPSKAAILSALAAFNADDDERDDTYDISDVGGTVDSASPENNLEEVQTAISSHNHHDEVLFHAYKADAQIFARDAATRRGEPRAMLKKQVGLTDEAIEGWAIMISRDGRLFRRLEAKFGEFTGVQTDLVASAWRATDAKQNDRSNENRSESVNSNFRRGGSGRRGMTRGTARGNNSGEVAGRETMIARKGKETNKSSRANHNRRDQRAKKIARGFAG